MAKGDDLYLHHMRDHAAKARALVAGRTRKDFDDDEVLRLALTYLVQTVGEAAGRVSAETQLIDPNIPWRSIIAMRHRLVHGYFAVDDDLVWRTVEDELGPLIDRLERLLQTRRADC